MVDRIITLYVHVLQPQPIVLFVPKLSTWKSGIWFVNEVVISKIGSTGYYLLNLLWSSWLWWLQRTLWQKRLCSIRPSSKKRQIIVRLVITVIKDIKIKATKLAKEQGCSAKFCLFILYRVPCFDGDTLWKLKALSDAPNFYTTKITWFHDVFIVITIPIITLIF